MRRDQHKGRGRPPFFPQPQEVDPAMFAHPQVADHRGRFLHRESRWLAAGFRPAALRNLPATTSRAIASRSCCLSSTTRMRCFGFMDDLPYNPRGPAGTTGGIGPRPPSCRPRWLALQPPEEKRERVPDPDRCPSRRAPGRLEQLGSLLLASAGPLSCIVISASSPRRLQARRMVPFWRRDSAAYVNTFISGVPDASGSGS